MHVFVFVFAFQAKQTDFLPTLKFNDSTKSVCSTLENFVYNTVKFRGLGGTDTFVICLYKKHQEDFFIIIFIVYNHYQRT